MGFLRNVSCSVCGHFAHRKNACNGGMGDYYDCPHEAMNDPHPEDIVRTFPVLIAAAVILRYDPTTLKRCVLLEKRAPTGVVGLDGMWDLPGGKVECGETPHEAVIREIKEELSIDVLPIRLIPELKRSVWTYADVTRHWIIAAYLCMLTNGEPVCHDHLQWFPTNELPADLLEADRCLIELSTSTYLYRE
jgi:8-oxo-dGTP diphosphatase